MRDFLFHLHLIRVMMCEFSRNKKSAQDASYPYLNFR